MKLNPQSPIPLYRQLADVLMARIRSGEYAPGTPIPSEHKLAQQYGIGRPTARQATDLLVRRQLLLRKRGAGTFVREDSREVDLFSLAGTLSAFQRKGISIESHILEPTRLITVKSNRENPFWRKKAFFFSRLSRVEKTPVLLEDIYLDAELFAGIDAIDLKDRSLSQIVEELYYLKPRGGKQNFRIGTLEGTRRSHLQVAATTPVLIVSRFLDFPAAEHAIYSELFCRTDQFVFSQTIGGFSHA